MPRLSAFVREPMPRLSDDDVKLRLADAIRDVQYLLSSGASKNEILTGSPAGGGRRGLNHVNELFMMLPDAGHTGEFKVRE